MLILLLGIILGMAGFAVRQPTHGPEQNERRAEAHQGQPAQEGKESIWRPSTYEPITAFTGALVLLTFVLAGVSVVQIRFLIRADETAGTAAMAATKQAIVAEQAFAGLERPYLFISDLSYSYQSGGIDQPGYQGTEQADPRRIWFNTDLGLSVRNFGKTPAIVKRLEYGLMHVFHSPEPRVERLSPPTRWKDVGMITASGEAIIEKYSFNMMIFARDEHEVFDKERSVFLKGLVIYEDVLQKRWHRDFLFRLLPMGGRMTEAGGSERNYERDVSDEPFYEQTPDGPYSLIW